MKKFILFFLSLTATIFALANTQFGSFAWVITLPVIYFVYYIMSKNGFEKKGVFDDPKYLNLLKTLVSLLGFMVVSGVNIPFLSPIIKTLTSIIADWDTIGTFVNFIIGFCLNIYAIWANKDSAIGVVAKTFEGGPKPRQTYL
jgi:hypothetical protein